MVTSWLRSAMTVRMGDFEGFFEEGSFTRRRWAGQGEGESER